MSMLSNLPGINLGSSVSQSAPGKTDIVLNPGSEWRFEVPFKSKYTIKV